MPTANQTRISDEMSQAIVATVEQIALSEGTERINVRTVLRALNITNRVFYNRFSNIDEVLAIVYENTVLKIRESIIAKFDPEGDFFAQVIDIVANTLMMSYENKMHLHQYIFASDSLSDQNFRWWNNEIRRLIAFGKQRGYLKDVDEEATSYAVWCFIRGYNADALGRGIPKEIAVRDFRYSFGILLDGMRAAPAE
jgi:AcrR family transcriptional regulator